MSDRSVRRAWLAGVTLLVAFGVTVGTAAAATPMRGVDGKKELVPSSSSGPGQGGSRPIARVGQPTAVPAAPAPAARGEVSPAAAYRQYVASYWLASLGPGEARAAWVYCPTDMVATGGGESNSSPGGVT